MSNNGDHSQKHSFQTGAIGEVLKDEDDFDEPLMNQRIRKQQLNVVINNIHPQQPVVVVEDDEDKENDDPLALLCVLSKEDLKVEENGLKEQGDSQLIQAEAKDSSDVEESKIDSKKDKDIHRRSGRVRKKVKLDYGDDETDSRHKIKSNKQSGRKRRQPDSSRGKMSGRKNGDRNQVSFQTGAIGGILDDDEDYDEPLVNLLLRKQHFSVVINIEQPGVEEEGKEKDDPLAQSVLSNKDLKIEENDINEQGESQLIQVKAKDSSDVIPKESNKDIEKNKDIHRRSGRVRKKVKLDFGDDETDSNHKLKSSKQKGRKRKQPDSSEEDASYKQRRLSIGEMTVKRNLRARKAEVKVDSDKESDSNTTESENFSYPESESTDWELSDNESYYPSKRKTKLSKPKKRSRKVKTKMGTGKNRTTDSNNECCQECKKGGHLLCCDTCPWAYHLQCLWIPLTEFPEKNWTCERCEHEPLGKITKILNWRFVDKKERIDLSPLPKGETEIKRKPLREFFVYWAEKSYWKCSWVNERKMKYYFQYVTMMKAFSRNQENWDKDEEEHSMSNEDEDLRDNPLYEKYYQNGIRPQWLKIHRILNERESEEDDSKMEYFVKWRDVPYSMATWESEDEDIPEFKKFITLYQEWKVGLNQPKKGSKSKGPKMDVEKELGYKYFHPPPNEPLRDVNIPYEHQPSFIDTEKGLYLHDYQLTSLNWLRSCWAKDTNTILADEMGLGKTIQAITFLYSLYKEGHSRGPFLITAPLSTINNWERELELWAPDFYIVNYTEYANGREVILDHDFVWDPELISGNKKCYKVMGPVKFHVLLTSYEMITKEVNLLSSINWKVVVVDEAHRLKNSLSLFYKHLNSYPLDYKLLLTGTPIQNNLNEIFNLFDFLCPELQEKLISLRLRCTENIRDEEGFKQFQDLVKRHILRRVKEDVLKDLPTKSEIVVKVELSPLQKQYYKFILTKNFDGLNSRSGGHWATLMMVIADLQKCCNHPYLFSKAMMTAPVLPNEIYETSALVEASGKLSLLHKMLRILKEGGHRVLIFSHSTKMLDILEDFLVGEEYGYERIDGSIMGTLRQDSVDRFNAPGAQQFVFLLSTKAGGLGINLASADTVILYDSDWNPHNDIQALSRTHRIGQKKKVMVYRLVSRYSLEERILQVAHKKLALHDMVLTGEANNEIQMTYSKQRLDSMIRYGTKELFEAGDAVRDNYTDENIRDLLDRSDSAIERKDNLQANHHTSTEQIKVVSCITEDSQECNVDVDIENQDPNYWQELLEKHCSPKKPVVFEPLGKRVRKSIDYKDYFCD